MLYGKLRDDYFPLLSLLHWLQQCNSIFAATAVAQMIKQTFSSQQGQILSPHLSDIHECHILMSFSF